MPLYYFVLKTRNNSVSDKNGQELTGDAEAYAHAVAVAQELMRNREGETRLWSILVCDDYLQTRAEVMFASVDRTIGHLTPEMHALVETVCRTAKQIQGAIDGVRSTMSNLRETMARADRLLSRLNGFSNR